MAAQCPVNYPDSQHVNSPDPPKHCGAKDQHNLPAVRVTYEYLRKGYAFCFFNVYRGVWTIQNAQTYMQVLGVKEEYTRNYIIHKAKALKGQYPSLPNWKSHLRYPSLWQSGIDLHQCIDTPMHHIFQGMVKGRIEFISNWFKFQRCHTQFIQLVGNLMTDISKLRLNWCNLDNFTGPTNGTGGWVAESYLGFSCLLPLWYGYVHTICDTNCINIKPLL